MSNTVLIYDDQALTILNPPEVVTADLEYLHRFFDRKTGSEKVNMLLYRRLDDGSILTFQGFLHRVMNVLKTHSITAEYRDARTFDYRFNPAKMHGFRAGQGPLLLKTLMAKQSGTLQAPTRYGKTTLFVNTLRAFEMLPTVIFAPGVDLLDDLYHRLKSTAGIKDRDIRGIYSGGPHKLPGLDINIMSVDSLEKADFVNTKLVLCDEPHALPSESRALHAHRFLHARRLAFGATIHGRYDKACVLIEGLFGPVLARRTFTEALKEKAVCPIKAIIIKVPFTVAQCRDRDDAYRRYVYNSETYQQLVAKIMNDILPKSCQTIAFIGNEKQAEALSKRVPGSSIAMAKRFGRKAVRKQAFADMVDGSTERCFSSAIYSTGVTFSKLGAVVVCCGGGASLTATQRAGRLAEVIPGKKYGILIDFQFQPIQWPTIEDPEMVAGMNRDTGDEWMWVWRDSKARVDLYRETGYEVTLCDTLDQVAAQVHHALN